MLHVMKGVVVDTSVFVSALRSADGASRQVLRLALEGGIRPVMGQKPFLEFLDLFERPGVFDDCPVPAEDRLTLLEGFLSTCGWCEARAPQAARGTTRHQLEQAHRGVVLDRVDRIRRRSPVPAPGIAWRPQARLGSPGQTRRPPASRPPWRPEWPRTRWRQPTEQVLGRPSWGRGRGRIGSGATTTFRSSPNC